MIPCDVDNYVKDVVKRTIYNMHNNRQHVTVVTLQHEIASSGIFNFSKSGLTRLLHHIGFSFKVDDGRRGLFEQNHIAASRVRFLREYFHEKEIALYDPVFMDETWIFSRGSPKRSWHDASKQSIKKKALGEGKRFDADVILKEIT
ncbi:hypothetical protein FQR65_LT11979 [Abscondita terminalis]|nr:hypothetical protein FQR65_LT11979 [Abscondita terminalis]